MHGTVVLDANLLVLLLVGTADKHLVGHHKKLKAFTESDVDTLVRVLDSFERVAVTPNIVTEACNIARYIEEPARGKVMARLALFCLGADETYVQSKQAATMSQFGRLGLTDVTIIASSEATCVLTADHDLHQELLRNGRESVNFNHVRLHGWSLGVGLGTSEEQ